MHRGASLPPDTKIEVALNQIFFIFFLFLLLYSLKLLIFAKSFRVMERITIDLPIVKVRIEDPWCGCDYGKEHYEKGLFVIDDGISRYLGMWDGLSLWNCPMPHGLIDKFVVEKTKEGAESALSELGFYWGDASDEMVLTHTIFLHKDGRLSFALSLQYFREHESPELSADDILSIEIIEEKKEKFVDCSEPCDEIKAVQELLRNSKHLKDKTLVITKDNAAIL